MHWDEFAVGDHLAAVVGSPPRTIRIAGLACHSWFSNLVLDQLQLVDQKQSAACCRSGVGSWRTIFKQLENQQLQHPFQTTGDQATTTTIRGTTIFKEQGTDQQRTQQQEAQQQKQQVIKFFTMLHCPFPVPDQTYVIRQRIAGATSSSVQSRHHLPELHIQVHFQETDVSVARTLWPWDPITHDKFVWQGCLHFHLKHFDCCITWENNSDVIYTRENHMPKTGSQTRDSKTQVLQQRFCEQWGICHARSN